MAQVVEYLLYKYEALSSNPSTTNKKKKKERKEKRADEVAQGVGPEFKPQYHTHKKSLKTRHWTLLLGREI
jgi:hypothetical protein